MKHLAIIVVLLLSFTLIGCITPPQEFEQEELVAIEIETECQTVTFKLCTDFVCEIHKNVLSFYVDEGFNPFKRTVTLYYLDGTKYQATVNRCILLGCSK